MDDQNMMKVTALPAAAATSNPTGLDSNTSPVVGQINNLAKFHLKVPATPALVDAKTIIYTIEHSDAQASGFTAIPGVGTHTSTGASSAGAAAVDIYRHIPEGTKRYVRCTAAVLTAGGDNTGVSYTFSVALAPHE